MKRSPKKITYTALAIFLCVVASRVTLAAGNVESLPSSPPASVKTGEPAVNPPFPEASSDTNITSLRAEMQELSQQLEQLRNEYQSASSQPVTLNSDREKQAYASGVAMAAAVKRTLDEQQKLGVILTPALVLQGMSDALNLRPLRMRAEDIRQALTKLDSDMRKAEDAASATQKKLGSEWFDTFKKQPGVITDNDVAYLVQTPGTGALVSAADTVDVRLSGRLASGEVFSDGSYIRRVKVSALLPAVAAGLQRVRQTGKIRIVVPPEKGYGDEGLYPDIPGGATLIYDAEVTAINNTEPLSAPPKQPQGREQKEGQQPDTTVQAEAPPRAEGLPEAPQNNPKTQP